ncbi:MAG: lysophospholipid transporter LplT [Burkholderiales bacterium]
MPLSFYTILAAQFFSALADNALLPAAIALLIELSAPKAYVPILQVFFVVSYIVFAPFVGAFADAMPKGRVMFISNGIKLIGCLAMLFGVHPLLAYGIVGFGAAAYSPAKYGILTELLPPSKLVTANAWMEGATVGAIILGLGLGGYLQNGSLYAKLGFLQGIPLLHSPAAMTVAMICGLYVVAALFNLYIPELPIDHKLAKKNLFYVLHDFWHCFTLLWRDPLGQVSLAVTTLFWGVGATLKIVIIDWAQKVLGFGLDKATYLTIAVAVGIAIGAAIAALTITLEKSVKVLPVGIIMGALVVLMVFVHDWRIAVVFFILIGTVAGFFVVPMNALLQHRGHTLMGAGHSIAVQNFNENLSIAGLNAIYAGMVATQFSINTITVLFGLFIAGVMYWLYLRHRNDVPLAH